MIDMEPPLDPPEENPSCQVETKWGGGDNLPCDELYEWTVQGVTKDGKWFVWYVCWMHLKDACAYGNGMVSVLHADLSRYENMETAKRMIVTEGRY